MSLILIDSYSENNRSGKFHWPKDNCGTAQSFIGKSGILINSKWCLRKYGNPTGNMIAKLYAHSGVYGISSIPSGEPLATSNFIDISTLTTFYQLITFNFEDEYELEEGVKYCIAIEPIVGANLDSSNWVRIGIDVTYPTHSGNASDINSVEGPPYIPYSDYDCIFYVYGEETGEYTPPAETDILSIAKPITLKTTKEINGAWIANMQILPDDYIQAESYIDIDGEQYIVKKPKHIKAGGKTYHDVEALHIGIAELTDLSIDRFSLLKSVEYLLSYILTNSEWTAGDCDIDEIVYLRTDKRTTILEALNLLADRCGGELYFHSDKTVDLKREIGTHTGLQIRYDKNSDYIEKEEDSYGLITRIYPYGPDNFEINSTILDNCEDETDYIPSGAGSTEASDEKQQGAQAIKLISSTLNETFIHDLGAGNVKDLSEHDSLKFWIYSEVANANGFTFGIGEAAYNELTVNSGALDKECWKEVALDLSEVADADKNAIRYIGFKNLTDGEVEILIDSIRAFSGNIYIDSPNINNYRVRKEYIYQHSAKPEKETFTKIIYPSGDAFVHERYPNSNFGKATYNSADIWPGRDTVGFMKWSLSQIPTGATITNAELNINVFYIHRGNTVNINYPAANWSENTVTWNNKPAAGANITSFDGNSIGRKTIDITTAFQAWWGGAANYGLRFVGQPSADARFVDWYTKEYQADKPYVEVTYTIPTDINDIIIAAAIDYLNNHDEPKLKYKVNMADLSKVMVNTWEDETVDLGDTVRVYDSELDINVSVRIKKITKDLLDPSNVNLELVNKAYSIADLEAKRAKQLSYAMPFADNEKIIDAGAIQVGYIGGDVQL